MTTTALTYQELDREARYKVDGFDGIAFYIAGPVILTGDDWDDTYEAEDRVLVIMVGDDRQHDVGVDELTVIPEDSYCHSCGQIGCTHDGRA